VRRDLGAEMASAARRDTGHIRHDARPPALETSRTAREYFPQAYATLAFLGGGAPLTVAAASAARGRRVAGGGEGTQGEQDNRWSILSRTPMTGHRRHGAVRAASTLRPRHRWHGSKCAPATTSTLPRPRRAGQPGLE
jgi:hypothetical protein